MAETVQLSPPALSLFRLHVERMGDISVDDSNRAAYQELEHAGLVILGRPFTGQPRYHLTKAGFDLKTATSPSHAESA